MDSPTTHALRMHPRIPVRRTRSPRILVRRMRSPRIHARRMRSPRILVRRMPSPRILVRRMPSPRILVRRMPSSPDRPGRKVRITRAAVHAGHPRIRLWRPSRSLAEHLRLARHRRASRPKRIRGHRENSCAARGAQAASELRDIGSRTWKQLPRGWLSST